MKRVICFILFLTLVNFNIFAQLDKIDSLEKKIESTPDSDLFELYYSLVYYSQYISQEKTIKYLNKCLEIAKKQKNQSRINDVYRDMGEFYDRTGNDSLSVHYYQMALEKFLEAEEYVKVSTTYLSLGNFYWKRSKWSDATDNYINALKISEEHFDSMGIAKAYNSLAFVFNRAEEYENALDYYLKSYEYWKKIGNKQGQSVSLNNIGNIYKNLKQSRKALEYYYISLSLKSGYHNSQSKDICYYNIAEIFLDLQKYDSARLYLHKGLHISKTYQNTYTLPYLYYLFGKVFIEQKEFDSAYFYLNKAKVIAVNMRSYEILSGIYNSLNNYFLEFEKIDSAYYYLEKHKIIEDSLKHEQARGKIASFESDRFKAKLDLLEKEKEISELKSERRANMLKFAIILIILVLVLFIVIYSRYSLKKRTNKLLEETNQKLETANQTKNRFFAIISHDLKNNLVAFQNISELLTENFDKIAEEKKHHLLVRLNKSSANLNNILSNLLLWSKSQLDYIDFQAEEFSFDELVKEVCQNHQEMADGKSIILNNSIEENMQVVADKEMIRVVVRNFLSNAIKFSPESTTVSLFSEKKANELIIGVKDEGLGISKSHQEKLFSLQEKDKMPQKGSQMGSGLGLIICKDFIERHKGKIWVESEENKGSTFYFSIPTE